MTARKKALGRVEISGEKFELAEQVGSGASTFLPHYKHSAATLLAQRTNVDGKPGRQNIRPEVQFFAQDSWAGGLGQKFYDPNKPKNYYRGSGNPRIDGLLASTPTRTDSVSPTGAYMAAPCFAAGGGYLYMANSDTVPVGHHPKIYQTADLVNWLSAEASEGADGDPSWNRNLAVDQGGRAYLLSGGPTQFGHINVFKPDLTTDVFTKESAEPTGSNLGPRGAAVHDQWLYAWTGVNLYRWDTTITPHPVAVDSEGFSVGRDDAGNFIATADIVNCGDGVVMFTSFPGMSRVYQFRPTVSGQADPAGSTLWTAPPDAILWSIAVQDGVVYVAGNQDKGVTVWGIDLQSNKVAPLVRINPDQEGVDA